ncbi:hypothetical protein OIO90_001021 [Microbotryomycetes sp. JL221]|nr:hypothetical protein OIO90_001021 [Microbotryomycetes sp. JL221]
MPWTAGVAWKAGSLLAATGVASGALGAHALASRLGNKSATWSMASHFAIMNGAALLAISQHPQHGKRLPGLLIATGTVMFSGSIFALLLYRERMGGLTKLVGPTTPLGGVLMIAGYLGLVSLHWDIGFHRVSDHFLASFYE